MEKLITAFLLGISLMRSFYGPLLILGLGVVERKKAIYFLIGRICGFILLGILIGIVGKCLIFPKKVLHLITGVVLVGVSFFLFFKKVHSHKKLPSLNFSLGMLIGIIPCPKKILILFPLCLGESLIFSVLIFFMYALSSSFYFLLALLGADVLHYFEKRKKKIKFFGVLIILLLGFYFIIKAIVNW